MTKRISVRLNDDEWKIIEGLKGNGKYSTTQVVKTIISTYPIVLDHARKYDAIVTAKVTQEVEKFIKDIMGGEGNGA